MKTLCIVFIYGLVFCAAHSAQNTKPTKVIVRDDNNCESNKSYFDYIAVSVKDDQSIILIAKLGDGETARARNRRRLHNISTYLNYIRKVPKNKIIRAEGERVHGRGRVEVYIGGKLTVVFSVGRHQDLTGGDCGSAPSDLYFPMRKMPK